MKPKVSKIAFAMICCSCALTGCVTSGVVPGGPAVRYEKSTTQGRIIASSPEAGNVEAEYKKESETSYAGQNEQKPGSDVNSARNSGVSSSKPPQKAVPNTKKASPKSKSSQSTKPSPRPPQKAAPSKPKSPQTGKSARPPQGRKPAGPPRTSKPANPSKGKG